MKSARSLTILGTLAVVMSMTAIASAGTAGSGRATGVIRHQVRGCHTWSFNGSPYRATQAIVVRRATSLTITNNDVMPHALIKVSGPFVRFANLTTGTASGGMGVAGKAVPGAMAHIGASTRIVFATAGVYRFVTKAGEDYPGMSGMKTVGEDNTLRLTVTVR